MNRGPFWLPASNYYIITIFFTAAFFFLIWLILHEENGDVPWLGIVIGVMAVFAVAVFLREVILRKRRMRFLLAQKQLDFNIKNAPGLHSASLNPNKLTLEKNASILNIIKRKSDAAKVLNKISSGHLEVFEICNEYLQLSKNELKTVGVGSPRLPALRRGREIVKELHRYHLLEWAEIEARALTQEAKNNATMTERLEASQKALSIIHTAMQFYPNEEKLKNSEDALNEFITTIKVSHWIEQAERSVFKENYKRAISHYRDALFYLGRENVQTKERDMIAEKITMEIEKIRNLEGTKKGKKQIKKSSPKLEENYD